MCPYNEVQVLLSGTLLRRLQTTPGFVTESSVSMWRCGSPWTSPTTRRWATRRAIRCCGHTLWPGTLMIESSGLCREDRSAEQPRLTLMSVQALRLGCCASGVSGFANGLGGTGIFLQPGGRGTSQEGSGLPRWLVRRADLWQRGLSPGHEAVAATAQLAWVQIQSQFTPHATPKPRQTP